MKPDPDEKLDALFRAARSVEVNTSRVEFGFETRVAARLGERRASGAAGAQLWGGLAWKLAPCFAAIVVVLAGWTYLDAGDPPAFDLAAGIGTSLDGETLEVYLMGGAP